MKRLAVPLLAALLAVTLCACDRQAGLSATASGASGAPGEGTISGRAIYSAAPPLSRIIPGSPNVPDESIVVGPDSGLKNVIVYLDDAPTGEKPATRPAVLDQINCVYVPHVLAVQAGQPLTLKSSDKMMHNVHLQCTVNPDANYGFNGPGTQTIVLKDPEAPFHVRCDVHPWMTAWIGVFGHPYFAVTDDKGNFTIAHVPPGTYTLSAWQEVLPQQEQKVTVANGSDSHVNFTFQAP